MKDWFWSWNSNTLATRCEELTHLKRPWCWERWRAGGEGDDRGWGGWMALPTQWTWVWLDSGSWWWAGRPGVLQFMGLQGVGHDRATELELEKLSTCLLNINHFVVIAVVIPPFSSNPLFFFLLFFLFFFLTSFLFPFLYSLCLLQFLFPQCCCLCPSGRVIISLIFLWLKKEAPLGLPWWLSWWRILLQWGRHEFDPWVAKIPWRRERPPSPPFWPGEFHDLCSLDWTV